MELGARVWVASAVLVLLVQVIGGGSARHVVINQSGSPISIERASVNGGATANNDVAVVVAQNSTMELPPGFAGSSLVVRNQLTGGAFGPFTLRRNAVMLVQSTGLLTSAVTVLLATVIQGVLTALTTLIAAL